MYECCNTAIKVQTVLPPFSPTAKLSISVVGINEIEVFSEVFPEVFPELFRRALHCFVSSENRRFGCGDGRGNRYRGGKRKSEFTPNSSAERFGIYFRGKQKNEEPTSAGNPPDFLPYCNSARIVV